MSDVVSRGPGVVASSEDRVVAGIIYGLLFLTPFFFGLTALIAPVLAYVRRPLADPLTRSHYAFQTRIFWIALVIFVLCIVAASIGLLITFGALGPGQPMGVLDVQRQVEASRRLHIVGVTLVVAGAVALIADMLWLMLAAVFGLARLLSGEPIGRLKAA
jgi:uncharacterized membrane protein